LKPASPCCISLPVLGSRLRASSEAFRSVAKRVGDPEPGTCYGPCMTSVLQYSQTSHQWQEPTPGTTSFYSPMAIIRSISPIDKTLEGSCRLVAENGVCSIEMQ
jgi:hypothetical protein